MDDEEFQQYVKNRYKSQVEWYDKKAVSSKRKYQILQYSIIVLSSITPVLIALQDYFNQYITIIIASLVAIGTAVLKAFKFQENWINYRTTCETLRKEIHYYNAGLNEYADVNSKNAQFVQRVESLISRENTIWLTSTKLIENTNKAIELGSDPPQRTPLIPPS